MTLAEARALAPSLGNLFPVEYGKVKLNNWPEPKGKVGYAVKYKDQADNICMVLFTENELNEARKAGATVVETQPFGVMAYYWLKIPAREVIKKGRKFKLPASRHNVKTATFTRPVKDINGKWTSQTEVYRFSLSTVKKADERAEKFMSCIRTKFTFKQIVAFILTKLGLLT